MSSQLGEEEARRVAEWTVTRGKNFFFDVYKRAVPMPLELAGEGGEHFISRLIIEFDDRYHEAITARE